MITLNELTSVTLEIANRLREEALKIAKECGHPPHFLVSAFIFAAVRSTLDVVEEINKLHPDEEIKQEEVNFLLTTAVEDALHFYNVDKNDKQTRVYH